MNVPLILVPAYGRSYSNEAEALIDWNAGKDFKIEGGPYCSQDDLDSMKENISKIISIRVSPGLYLSV